VRPSRKGPTAFNWASVTLGLTFLYAPIVLLVLYSFNASRLVTVWGGFSTRWYSALAHDAQMLDAVWVTLRVGLLSATAATVLGVLAAVALVRAGRFKGRALLSGMIYAPLVMPEVILGLSLLLLFVAFGLPRGFWTVTISHATVTLCYATVVVQARLASFDRSLEEAAQDLGCSPFMAFMTVTLPNIAPAVAAAWMLAFTLSLDDLVIASFTSGPGATTLPMRLYSQVRLGVNPEINAVSTLLIGVVATGVIAVYLTQQRRRRPAWVRRARPCGAGRAAPSPGP
jgi:putrescine transport system permease protein